MFKKIFILVFMFGFIAAAAYAGDFKLTSPTIKPDGFFTMDQVYNGFGCSGKNQSPALEWTPGPKGTKSYAITVYDPDAPTGSGWWHWVVYNIPADVTGLEAGAGDISGKLLPKGAVHGRTDFGTHAFGGACPPKGDKPHRYVFTIHALKTDMINVPKDASAALIGFNINFNSIASAGFTANYGR